MSISQKFKEWVAPIDDDEILEVVDDEAPALPLFISMTCFCDNSL